MTDGGVPTLSLDANLRLVADGCAATIEASGREVTLRTEDVGGFLVRALESSRALPGGIRTNGARPLLGQLVDSLDRAGLSARVVGPSGTVIAVGHDCGARTGQTPGGALKRAVLGSSQVRFGAAPALAATAMSYVRASEPARRNLRYAAIVAAALFAGAGIRNRAAVNPNVGIED